MRRTRVLVLPAILMVAWLMLDPYINARSDTPAYPTPETHRATVAERDTAWKTVGMTVEVDGIKLGMTRSEAAKVLSAQGLLKHGPRLIYSSDGKVKAVVDGRSVAVPGLEPRIRVGARKEVLRKVLGSPSGEEPGLAGCDLDPTLSWLYPIKGGALRVYIYRESHKELEIAPDQRSNIAAFDLVDSLYGSYRGP